MRVSIERLRADLPPGNAWVLGFVGLVLSSVFVAVGSGDYYWVGLPFLALVAWMAVVDLRLLYWLLIGVIPFSTEVNLPGGFGTDLPTEPLIIGLMIGFGMLLLTRLKTASFDLLLHPITLLLLLHLGWIGITTLTSGVFVISLKFLLAKVWYIATFYFVTAYIVRTVTDFRRFFWVFFGPFLLMVSIIVVRHALLGFSFQGIHSIMHPFQRNHVNYAASMAFFFPFMALMLGRYAPGDWQRRLLGLALVFIFVAIYFSFTRAAYVALVIALGTYFIIRWRLMRFALVGAGIAAIWGVVHFVNDNNYLEYAPNYDRTISHEQFDNLIEATYKLEDISTMERVYRWVAAGQMAPHAPVLGWGPGTFVSFYKPFAVTSFQTYVSDNPEQSGIHNYFLMTLVEQGVPGLVLFLTFLVVVFIRGERLYHALAAWPDRQRIVMSVLLSLTVIVAFLLINDLVETDKVGSFFFINIAILVNQDLFLLREGSSQITQKSSDI